MNKILPVLLALVLVMPVFAVHTSKVALNPVLTGSSVETQFTINVTNLGKDRIGEARIRMPIEYSGLKCGSSPSGWTLAFSDAVECNYKTVADYMNPNSSRAFAVTAKTGSDDNNYTWEIRTKDAVDGFFILNPVTLVDKTPPAIKGSTLVSPNGGEKWISRSSQNIVWKSADITDANLKPKPITIEYSTDGKNWTLIAKDHENTGSYTWTLPDINGSNVKVRLTASDAAGNAARDESSESFAVSAPLPTTVLIEGDTLSIDVDKDGRKDFNVTLVDTTQQTAIVVFTPIKAAATAAPSNATTTTVPSRADQTSNIIIVVLVVIVAYLIWKLQKTGKKK